MEINEYLEKKKKIQEGIIQYIEGFNELEEDYSNLLCIFIDQQIRKDRRELKATFQLIMQIANNHNRSPNFFSKIEHIIIQFKKEILNYYTNSEIFDLFGSNKRILLFLFEEKMILLNHQILDTLTNYQYHSLNYDQYFKPEIYSFIESQLPSENESEMPNDKTKTSESFEKNRKIGENDGKLAQLIQHDLIDEFISYINQNNIILSYTIKSSIFETNLFLINKNPSLIEYSAFFGSIQIFKYLYKNKVKLTPSLWIYGVHGQDPEIIKILEEESIVPDDETFTNCLIESIKCHHIETTNYIQRNFIHNEYNQKVSTEAIKRHNYLFFPDPKKLKNFFFYFCSYDYLSIVEFLLRDEDLNVNLENQNHDVTYKISNQKLF
ncbi:hypothetical protein M9Y10_024043 [Tritrichomonas musculus]|uniref:DUF3447 domain-containing protein n=1 Tax=Tritrichomonas musculus TaxID=1915356 RepID=A0ABR2KWZ2_9EUKA